MTYIQRWTTNVVMEEHQECGYLLLSLLETSILIWNLCWEHAKVEEARSCMLDHRMLR